MVLVNMRRFWNKSLACPNVSIYMYGQCPLPVLRGRSARRGQMHSVEQALAGSESDRGGGTPNTNRSSMFVGLSMRMKLDTGLVHNILQEMVGTEPFGDHHLGRALLSPDGDVMENNQPIVGID